MEKMMPEPFLKWAGGKRWLVQRYSDLLPRKYNTYIEPFVGSGAVFFYLRPQHAILSDSNTELINTYLAIRSKPINIHNWLKRLHRSHGYRFYYHIRNNIPNSSIQRAIRFLYLNRTCFNGLYRVNLNGYFNVPIGTKSLVKYPDNYLEEIASTLRHAKLLASDFEPVVDKAGKGDFLYIDPPYTVMHNNNNFIKYNANLFSWQDQIRLAASIKRASKRGVLIMVSNADHLTIKELYGSFGNHIQLNRTSLLSGSGEYRKKTTELVITNYSN